MFDSNAVKSTKYKEQNNSHETEIAKFYNVLLVFVIIVAVAVALIFLIASIQDRPQTSDPISEAVSQKSENQMDPSLLSAGSTSTTNSTSPLPIFNPTSGFNNN